MTNAWFTFQPVDYWWLWIAVIAALGVFFISRELRRTFRFRTIRLIAQVLVVIALILLILRPAIKTEKDAHLALLLTNGYVPSIVDSLLRIYPKATLLHTPDATPYESSRSIGSLHALTRYSGDIKVVVGVGLPDYALDQLTPATAFVPSPQPDGIVNLNLEEEVIAHQPTTIAGTLRTSKGNGELKLQRAGYTEDSINITQSIQNFSFDLLPLQSGEFVYTLLHLDTAGKVINSYPLPLSIGPERKLSILVLQHYPTFEASALKNFLGALGHSLTLRYQLSKSNYRYEYVNTPDNRWNSLSTKTFDELDLLMIDPETLEALSRQERIALDESIRSGLGMIVTTSKPQQKGTTLFPFDFVKTISDTVHIQIPHHGWMTEVVLPYELKSDPKIQRVLETTSGDILSGYVFHGFGKIGIQRLRETYRHVLENRPDVFGYYWNSLLSRTARTNNKAFHIRVKNSAPLYIDEPLEFEIISAQQQPSVSFDGIPVPLAEDIAIDDLWGGEVWTSTAGWHTVDVDQDSTRLSIYVFDKNDWQSLAADKMRTSTLLTLSNAVTEKTSVTDEVIEPINPFLFFLLLLAGLTALWLVPKL